MFYFILIQLMILVLFAVPPLISWWRHESDGMVIRWYTARLADLCSDNNARLKAMMIIASVWTIEMFLVYAIYGLPESPAHAAYREMSSTWGQLEGNTLEKFARWWTGEYGDIKEPTALATSSWMWFWAVVIGWTLVGIYLPVALRDEVGRFFSKLFAAISRKKQLASGGSPSTPAPSSSTMVSGAAGSPHKRFSPAWFLEYLADDVISDAFMGFMGKLFRR